MVPRGENGERDTLGGWHSHVYINTDTTDNPQGPTVEHGNATQHWQVLYGKGTSKRIYVYVHVYIYIWAGATILEPEQTWVKLRELGRMGQQRSPFGRRVPGPLWMGPRSPDPGGSSSRWTKPTTRKGGRALRTGRALKIPLVSKSPGAGVPTSSPMPHDCPTHTRATELSALLCCRGWD